MRPIIIAILVFFILLSCPNLYEGLNNGPPIQQRAPTQPAIRIKGDSNPRLPFANISGGLGQCIASDFGVRGGPRGIFLGTPTGISSLTMYGKSDCGDSGYKINVDSGLRFVVPSQYGSSAEYGQYQNAGFHIARFPNFSNLKAVRFN